jgi:hypothetical protein
MECNQDKRSLPGPQVDSRADREAGCRATLPLTNLSNRTGFLLSLHALWLLIGLLQNHPAQESKLAKPTAAATLTADSLESLARQVEPVVEELRGRKFRKPVPVALVSESEARAYFQAELLEEWPKDKVRAESRVLAHLGLVPPATDLESLLLDVLEEQAGGYYDPKSGTFFVLQGVPQSSLAIVMAHELTHALDDQYFGIDSTLAAFSEDEDRANAYAAVVEGSGTAVMAAYVAHEMSASRLDAGALADVAASDLGRTQRLEAAPPVVRRALLGPYVLGLSFLLRGDLSKMAQLETADFDRAFQNPPASFEQILHPEKYWEESSLDPPVHIADLDLEGRLGRGWKSAGSGVLGELLIASLTTGEDRDLTALVTAPASDWTNSAATGWDGDRWELYTDGTHFVTVLATLWDTERDAQEFTAALHFETRRVERRGRAVVILAGDKSKHEAKLATACLDALVAMHP